jgi:capsular exopolysaccharide synthesis family protein
VVEPAIVPEAPSKPRKLLNLALGFLIGLAGGIGLAFLFENLDTTLYTTDQIEAVTNTSPLGGIPSVKQWKDNALVNGNSQFGEAFRRIRTQIFVSAQNTPPHTILITSAEQGEGKSMVSANLGFAIAQTGKSVIVVDCDLRKPSQHRIFTLTNKSGLSNILIQNRPLEEAVQVSKIPGLQVLTSGPLPVNPAELLGSKQMEALIHLLMQQFDVVLLDTPSLLAVTDAALLVPYVDSVLLVVSRGESRDKAVRDAYKQLSEIHARSIGVVINHTEQDGQYYYYQRKPKKPDKQSNMRSNP